VEAFRVYRHWTACTLQLLQDTKALRGMMMVNRRSKAHRAALPLLLATGLAACTGVIGGGGDGLTGPDGDTQNTEALDGVTPLRRLTALQYERTVHDLLGVDVDGQAILAADERVGPFKSNAVAPVTELNVDQYMAAAETVAQAALADLGSLVPCDPQDIGELSCGEAFIDDFGPIALRRPLDDETRAELRRVLEHGLEQSFEDGIRLVIQAALQSPYFLYHVESPGGDVGEDGRVGLSPFELASRLSYFLWRTMPDRALFEAAEAGELDTPEGIREQVLRMLDDHKAEVAIQQFHLQWLHIDELGELAKDPDLYPDFDAELLREMVDDVARVADYVVREGDAKLDSLLTTPYTFATGRLADYYGIDPVEGDEPTVLDRDQRAGLLTQPAFLAKAAHGDQSSPIHRGVVVREDFLCQILPDPPADVDDTPPDPDPNATTRERFAQHTEDPSCAGCHSLIDGIGFGFEAYDAIGQFREMDGNDVVDDLGEIVGGDDASGTFEGAIELSNRLVESSISRHCVANQWFRFALGRMEGDADAPLLDEIYADFDASHDLRDLIVAIAQSDAFRTRYAGQ